MAVLSFSRSPIGSGPEVRVEDGPRLELYAEAVQEHRDLGVLAGGEDHVHTLLLVEVLAKRGPGRIADEEIVHELVRRPDQRLFGRRPIAGVGAGLDRRDLLTAQPLAQ